MSEAKSMRFVIREQTSRRIRRSVIDSPRGLGVWV